MHLPRKAAFQAESGCVLDGAASGDPDWLGVASWDGPRKERGQEHAYRLRVDLAALIWRNPVTWPGVRRAGLMSPKAERGADAGPAAPQAPP